MWRQWLRPTRWALGIVLVFWLWRAGSYAARADYGMPWRPDIAIGFLWDVSLAAAVVWGHRALRGVQPGRKFRAWLALSAASLALLASSLSRGADLAYCAMTGGHWDAPGFLYLDLANIKLLGTADAQILLLAIIAAWALSTLFLLLDARRLSMATVPGRGWQRRLRPVVVSLALLLPIGAGQGATEHTPSRFVPEANFIHQWIIWRGLAGVGEGPMLPEPLVLARLKAAGLAPALPIDLRYPLMRASIDPTPFPHPAIAVDGGLPNVIFTFVEQLDHLFVHEFSGRMRGLMPQLSALSRRMTMVTDYRSTTTPTIHALVAGLCSLHGSSNFRELNQGKGSEALERTPLSCLPEILRRHGYRTVYIQGAEKEFSGKGNFLLAHGFDEVHDLEQIDRAYPRPGASRWGSHDISLVNYALDQIRRLEKLKQIDGRPYFLMVMTLDTHAPGFATRDCKAPRRVYRFGRGKRAMRMLDALHCSDKEIGRLGRFVMDDKRRRESTLFMLTGDHPTSRFAFVRNQHRQMKTKYQSWYGRLPMLIHDPGHKLPKRVPVLSGHTDIAPTLLHMLGLTDVPNAMTGHSIFGLRPRHPVLLGRKGNRSITVYTPDGVKNLGLKGLERRCKEGKLFDRAGPSAPHPCDVLAWVRWHNTLWRHKRVLPVARR